MRKPSRLMPKLPVREMSPLAAMLLLAVLAAVAIVLVVPAILIAILALVSLAARRRAARHFRQMAAERAGESICQFARSFNVRRTDTWVIRAVYEELQYYVPRSTAFPLHADDSICSDLRIDPDDLDMDIVLSIATRAQRSLKHPELNPHYGKVQTVRDLVNFFVHQPREGTEIR